MIPAMTQTLTAAEPTAMRHRWFPAAVLLPDGQVWHNRKVYAADSGLFIYGMTAGNPARQWSSPIDYGATPRPPRGKARNGFTVATAAGPVTITEDGGCGCSHPLKRWAPQFASTAQAWPRAEH